MSKYNLRYKTFDQLLSEVKGDFEAYSIEDKIKTHNLLSVAKRVTYDLGLKIFKTKNVILEVEYGRAKLPDDFYILNFLYGLGRFTSKDILPQGTHVEEIPLPVPDYHPGTSSIDICATPPICPTTEVDPCDPCQAPEPCGCNTCNCDTWVNCKGQTMTLIQKVKYQVREWTEFYRIKLLGDDKYYDPLCPNKTWYSGNTGYIRDGYIYFSFKTGEVYLNYMGMMEDEQGNLLVLDHDGINPYYEYALKKKILETLLANRETVDAHFIKLIMEEYRIARNYAVTIVRTPDFKEMQDTYKRNKTIMFNRYYKMFT